VFIFLCLSIKVGDIYIDKNLKTSEELIKKVKKHNCVKWTFVLLSQADIWLSHALPNNYYDFDNIEEFRKYGRRAAITYVATSIPLIIFKIMLISYLLIMGQQIIKILERAGYIKNPTLARVLMFCLAFF
jgi:hypothetical protein